MTMPDLLGSNVSESTNGGSGTLGGSASAGAGTSTSPAVLRFRVARVSPERLNLRAEPGRSAAVVDQLAEGAIVEPLGPAQDADGLTWLQVRADGGTEGWAATTFLDVAAVPVDSPAPPSPPDPDVATNEQPAESASTPEPGADVEGVPGQPVAPGARYRVNADSVRLRERPGTGDDVPILTVLRSGTLVDDKSGDTVSADGMTWRQVSLDGQTGWVATQFLTPITGGHYSFDATTPTELQVQDWTCSIRSVMWCLKSIGVAVTPAEAQDHMWPRYVSSDLGLLDASGAGIVEILRDAWGVTAFNRAPVSFDEVAGWAGRYPIALGGRNWGHRSAVRGVNEAGDLVTANPGGTGPRFGQQTLNRQQFADLGWFSAVVIPVE
jgi:uncharacterized protein YraI